MVGRVRDVIYLGPETRYVVDLNGAGTMRVVRQNAATSAHDARGWVGRDVRLTWPKERAPATNLSQPDTLRGEEPST